MATTKFNAEKVNETYKAMKAVIGTNGESGSIKDIFDKIEKKFKEYVNQEGMAIYGVAASDLMNQWDLVTPNFDEFIANFDNWAAVVSSAAGRYDTFATDVANWRDSNPYGIEGKTQSAFAASTYANRYSLDELDQFQDMNKFYQLTGATYVDTGMVEFAAKNKVYRVVGDVLNVAAIAASGVSIFKVVQGGAQFVNGTMGAGRLTVHQTLKGQAAIQSAGLTGIKHTAKYASTYAKLLLIGGKTSSRIATGFWGSIDAAAKSARVFSGVAVGGGVLSSISHAIGSSYDSSYATGTPSYSVAGSGVTINNKEYCFLGSTPNGTNLYSDDTGAVFYLDVNGSVQNAVVYANGQSTPANLDTMNDNFQMYLGSELITQDTNLTDYSTNGYNSPVGMTGFISTFNDEEEQTS